VVTVKVPKIRRGGFVFVAFVGDHPPRLTHVYFRGRLILRWDLEHDQPVPGGPAPRVSKRLRAELRRLGEERRP
jgi:hypothetical protein